MPFGKETIPLVLNFPQVPLNQTYFLLLFYSLITSIKNYGVEMES